MRIRQIRSYRRRCVRGPITIVEKKDDKFSAIERINIQQINWTISRQNVLVAIFLTSIIGTFQMLNSSIGYSKVIYSLFVVAIPLEFWAILNFEKHIIECDVHLEEIPNSIWKFEPNTTIKWFFNIDAHVNINKKKLLFVEFIIVIVLASLLVAKIIAEGSIMPG